MQLDNVAFDHLRAQTLYHLINPRTYPPGCVEQDVDYYGSDLTSYGHVWSFEACKKKCQDYYGCTHFTYVPDDFEDRTILNTCHLKYATTGKMSVVGLSSGAVDCVDEEVTEEPPRSERSQPEEPDTSNQMNTTDF